MGQWLKIAQTAELAFGRGEFSNIKLSLNPASYYSSNMGQVKEMADEVFMQVKESELFHTSLVKSASL